MSFQRNYHLSFDCLSSSDKIITVSFLFDTEPHNIQKVGFKLIEIHLLLPQAGVEILKAHITMQSQSCLLGLPQIPYLSTSSLHTTHVCHHD